MTDAIAFRMKIHEAIEDLDFEAVEFARDEMRPEFSADIVSLYRIHGDWVQRSMLIHLAQDQTDPALEEIMVDFLRAPCRGEDWSDFAKIGCLRYLTGEMYFDRPEAEVYAKIDSELAARGLSLVDAR